MDGAWTAAWPLVRADIGLSYTQVGLLLSAPHFLGNILEPPLGILGDAWDRRALVRAGGVAFVAALALVALSHGLWPLLAALALLSPAAGALVGLSQATLMDGEPRERERNMARWALAGSLGTVAGPLLVAAAARVDLGWRGTFAGLAVLAALVLHLVWRAEIVAPARAAPPHAGVRRLRAELPGALAAGAREAVRALRRREVVRWLVLLELADPMLDVLTGYLALYFVDVAGVSGTWAAIALAVWTGAGLLGDALLVPLLTRVPGTRWLRASALAVLAVFPAFLIASGTGPKLVLLGALGLLRSGWYAILKGRLYAAMPGRSATVMTLANASGLVGSLIPLAIGLAAERYGLGAAMWLLLVAPAALLGGVPRRVRGE